MEYIAMLTITMDMNDVISEEAVEDAISTGIPPLTWFLLTRFLLKKFNEAKKSNLDGGDIVYAQSFTPSLYSGINVDATFINFWIFPRLYVNQILKKKIGYF